MSFLAGDRGVGACIELLQLANGGSARLGGVQSFPAAFGNFRHAIASRDQLFTSL